LIRNRSLRVFADYIALTHKIVSISVFVSTLNIVGVVFKKHKTHASIMNTGFVHSSKVTAAICLSLILSSKQQKIALS